MGPPSSSRSTLAPLRATLPHPRPAPGNGGAALRGAAFRDSALRGAAFRVAGRRGCDGRGVWALSVARGGRDEDRAAVRSGRRGEGRVSRPESSSVRRERGPRGGSLSVQRGRLPSPRAPSRSRCPRSARRAASLRGRGVRLTSSLGRGRCARRGSASLRRKRTSRGASPSVRRGRGPAVRDSFRPSYGRPVRPPPSPGVARSRAGEPPLPARSPREAPSKREGLVPGRPGLRLGVPLPVGAPPRPPPVVGRPRRGPSGRRGRPAAASLGTGRVYRPRFCAPSAVVSGRRPTARDQRTPGHRNPRE
jgi:hypothetical protein